MSEGADVASDPARRVTEYDAAVATITQEHHALRAVMDLLQHLLIDIGKQHAEPDFSLLAAALYYIDDFPERCHHPKEDRHLFMALRSRTAVFNALLDELQSEHVRSAQMMAYLQRALVHYQGGAPDGFRRFKDAVDAYAGMLAEHMRKEEELLSRAREHLTAADWHDIAAAFEANEDPMVGPREEFRRLYLRIVNRLPRKMRLPPQRRGDGQ